MSKDTEPWFMRINTGSKQVIILCLEPQTVFADNQHRRTARLTADS
jgi:hypothetical protein